MHWHDGKNNALEIGSSLMNILFLDAYIGYVNSNYIPKLVIYCPLHMVLDKDKAQWDILLVHVSD